MGLVDLCALADDYGEARRLLAAAEMRVGYGQQSAAELARVASLYSHALGGERDCARLPPTVAAVTDCPPLLTAENDDDFRPSPQWSSSFGDCDNLYQVEPARYRRQRSDWLTTRCNTEALTIGGLSRR